VTVTVKGYFAGELVVDAERYPKLMELLQDIISAEFFGDPRPGDVSQGSAPGKKRGRPKKDPVPEATQEAIQELPVAQTPDDEFIRITEK
jgi:hypothetical protein